VPIAREVSRSDPDLVEKVSTMAGNTRTEAAKAEAVARAEKLRLLFAELAHLGVRKAAEELNRRKVETAAGRRWHPMTVLRVRKRLQSAVVDHEKLKE
jgi:hypothetical protein